MGIATINASRNSHYEYVTLSFELNVHCFVLPATHVRSQCACDNRYVQTPAIR